MLTFSDQIQIASDGAGKDTSTASQTFFKQAINRRDNFCISKMPSWYTEISRTFSTVADQQYYHYPPSFREIKAITISINSRPFPLRPVHSYQRWKELNLISIEAGAIPEYYFKRQRDFGIYPIPQDAYTGTIDYQIRGGNMVRTDYTTGTCSVTENDETVTGSGTAWSTNTNIQAGDWFVLTDSNGEPRGSWYRVGSITDATNLELESVFEEDTESTVTYKIGQVSELPEEYQDLPAFFALGDYYMGFRQSPNKAQRWYNMAWTGDVGVSRTEAERSRKPWPGGGLLGMLNEYRDRSSSQTIDRARTRNDTNTKRFASSIS